MSTLSIALPDDYVLARDLCSYGYFLLEPNHWDPGRQEFTTTLDLGDAAVTVRVVQRSEHARRARRGAAAFPAGGRLVVRADRTLDAPARREVRARLVRILRLDEPTETIREFHRLDPRFAASGRGRLMRSASLFEDVIKTVTSCNVTWPSTVNMNRRLCEVFGRRSASGLFAFPTSARLSRARPASLRARCSVGYRDARIVELARIFEAARRGRATVFDPAMAEDPEAGDESLFKALQELPGIGPYAAANILQLLGRYSRLPLDTESVRHGRKVLGYTGSSAQVMRRLHAHYRPFGEHRFRSYWFELWEYYEAKRGHSWTWEKETTGRTFTAALLD